VLHELLTWVELVVESEYESVEKTVKLPSVELVVTVDTLTASDVVP
jgi:hypothetical protein